MCNQSAVRNLTKIYDTFACGSPGRGDYAWDLGREEETDARTDLPATPMSVLIAMASNLIAKYIRPFLIVLLSISDGLQPSCPCP